MRLGNRTLKHLAIVVVCISSIMGLDACQVATSPSAPDIPTPTVEQSPAPRNTPTASLPPQVAPEDEITAPTATETACPPTPTPSPSPTPTPVPPSDAVLTRGPYLQSVTPNTIVIVWETEQSSAGEIAYGATTEYGLRVADPTIGTRHAVTLRGLMPYTLYHYRVESGGAPLISGGEATFRTAAGPDQTKFTFAVLGDTRTQHKAHQAVVEQIVVQEPDFVVHTGDLVALGSATHQWETFFEIERELMAHAPLFPALGNHEGNNPHYFDLFHLPGNERWYDFEYGNAHFICLQVDGFADFGPQSEQYAWLEQTLALSTQPWLFVYFHVPPYSSVEDDLEATVRQTLTPLFEWYGVDIVFNGHKHSYERNEVNGVTYVVTAGGGAPLYAMNEREPTQVVFVKAHHLTLIEIDGRRLKATIISSEGQVLDTFEQTADR